MKKFFKILGLIMAGILVLIVVLVVAHLFRLNQLSKENMALLGEEAPVLEIDGNTYRDLNKNGVLDIYEDSSLSVDRRVEDLLMQMTLEEKAGLMFINLIGMSGDGSLSEGPDIGENVTLVLESNSTLIAKKKMNHFNIMQSPSAKAIAIWNNNIQKLAERTRLGIPVTIATDPRHVTEHNIGANVPTPFFSKWCSPLGMAAIGDTNLMREFGDIARQEYMALGMRLALSPMADLATEPRWGRINGTFGEDAELSAQLTKAYILGFQGDTLNSNSVACMTKHFSGGGPQKDGDDPHFPYGSEQAYPGDNFDYHLIPFEKGAFPAHTAQIMPYYGIPVGQTSEDVGFGYNKEIITGMLRLKYGFDGVICTDWGLVTGNFIKPAAAWGVQELTELERAEKILNAGCDMFGGESSPEWIIELVSSGKLSEDRVDISVRRILRDKFQLGLFDNPFVNADNLSLVGHQTFIVKGKESQRKSLVLLKNDDTILPLKKGIKVFVQGFDKEVASQFSEVVSKPQDADIVLLRVNTPYSPRSDYFLERFFRQGRLDIPDDEKRELLELINKKPTITVLNLQRPAVIPDINANSKALIADFDSEDDAILGLIFGEFSPSGKLPFELPSSAQAVIDQKEDLPYDSKNPLYPFGFGLTY